MPVSLVSTWVIDRIGLRWTIMVSTGLAFCGALMKFLVTFPGLGKIHIRHYQNQRGRELDLTHIQAW